LDIVLGGPRSPEAHRDMPVAVCAVADKLLHRPGLLAGRRYDVDARINYPIAVRPSDCFL